MKKSLLFYIFLFGFINEGYAELPTGWQYHSTKNGVVIYANKTKNQLITVKEIPMSDHTLGAKDFADFTSKMMKKDCGDSLKVEGDDKYAVIKCMVNEKMPSETYLFGSEEDLTVCSSINGPSEETVKEIMKEHKEIRKNIK